MEGGGIGLGGVGKKGGRRKRKKTMYIPPGVTFSDLNLNEKNWVKLQKERPRDRVSVVCGVGL